MQNAPTNQTENGYNLIVDNVGSVLFEFRFGSVVTKDDVHYRGKMFSVVLFLCRLTLFARNCA